LSKIISIATKLPPFKHKQDDLFAFAEKIYCNNETESRKLKFLYRQSGITNRYSVVPDYSVESNERIFFPHAADLEPFPTLEKRMKLYQDHAANLCVDAIEDCISNKIKKEQITHLVTVSCTGMSAPGIDLEIMEMMGLQQNIVRTSVNFMGCYAAIHGLKLADAFCKSNPDANVMVVCVELCTLHFQKSISADNMTSSLLFADGCAAMLIQPGNTKHCGFRIKSFFSDVSFKGKKDMAWELSSTGFLMTLTGYVPELIREDFSALVEKALSAEGLNQSDISHWCIHPGGKKILDTITMSLGIKTDVLKYSYEVLNDYGNMSSPTILFVLKKLLEEFEKENYLQQPVIFSAAFGPGLTMETFTATYD